MSAMTPAIRQNPVQVINWAIAVGGLMLLYVPTTLDLAAGLWQQEENAHGPIVLLVAWWLLWQRRDLMVTAAVDGAGRAGGTAAGWALLSFGLSLYVLGRSQGIILFEVGSQVPVIAGVLAVMRGWSAVRAAWFPLFFLLFMAPLPGPVVDALTGPLKQSVSVLAEQLLYGVGYPIARNGVVLTIGQYQLLVADACSGLNSMFSLSALGLLYLHLVRYPGWWRNGIFIASILPVAFAANVVRVIVLVLVTYHVGDEAGQGFIHGFAGMLLFVIALLLLFVIDGGLAMAGRLLARRTPA